MLKIVYTIGSLKKTGGVERVLINKANCFVQKGLNVTILVADDGAYNPAYKINDKVKVEFININRYDNYITKIPLLGFFYKMHKLKKVYKRIVNKLNPDFVINVERGFEDFILHKLNVYSIRESHSSKKAVELMNSISVSSFKDTFFTRLYHRELLKFNKVIFLTKEDMLDRKFKNGNIFIPNLITKFDIEPDYNTSSKIVISVGRLDQFKNFKDQIEVWVNIRSKHPDWQLHIYGNGPEKENLQRLISELKLEQSVFLKGTTLEIEKKFQLSSFFLFTSLAEGFGMVLVEAMQMGLPVISYDCPCGPKDIIDHAKDGFLIELKNKSQLEKTICNLIEQPLLREEMSKNAILKSQNYLADKIIPKWLELFSQLKK